MLTSFCLDIYQMLCKKYPNRKIYVISDHHFYHRNIIDYTRDMFSDVLEMNEYIIKRHNETVGVDDIVIFLGDFSFKKGLIKELLEKMNGHKYLILGNHDCNDLVKNYSMLGFERVFNSPVKLKDDYLSHEPLIKGEVVDQHFDIVLNEFKKCSSGVNYHGHIHTGDNSLPSVYKNVACEVIDYKPVMIGRTTKVAENDKDNLFINSEYFDDVLTSLKYKHALDPFILLSDYIYCSLLEISSSFYDKYFVQGSFGLLKKYNFLSKMSDLDISFLYDPSISKNKNYSLLKEMVDECYEALKQFDKVNLKCRKFYPMLRIFEAMYVSEYPYFANCIFDANLVSLDCYRDSDFVSLDGGSIIQKYLLREESSLLDEYKFPHFKSQFLTPEGDMANLLLRVLFQKDFPERRILSLRELQYIYMNSFKNEDLENFSDIFVRFFLRNIGLLYSMNRYSEIEYIQKSSLDMSFLSKLPVQLQYLFYEILNDPNSLFLDVYNEIADVPVKDTLEKCSDIALKIKKR